MELVSPKMIPYIDSYAEKELNIPAVELMRRAGMAAFDVLREIASVGSRVLVLAGKGNNGGDGYALALFASELYEMTVVDVFSSGQRSPEGRYYYNCYMQKGGRFLEGVSDVSIVEDADIIIDAIFGTGACGEPPKELSPLIDRINRLGKKVLAIDIPLGVNAEDGRVAPSVIKATATLQLAFMKVGTLSYPAKEFLGKIYLNDLGLPRNEILSCFEFNSYLTDASLVKTILGKRGENTNKGSFGKALVITGSDTYEGAGRLSLEAALRGGAGIVTYHSSRQLRDRLIKDFPEAIYTPFSNGEYISADEATVLSQKHTATLIGSGLGVSRELYSALAGLISSEGGALVLDADAINSLAEYGSAEDLRLAKRKIILTPHPLEFSRLSGISVGEINSSRIQAAKRFAKEYNCILVLKGAATVITDGEILYLNSTGSSALAKGGSGDALAGVLVSLLAFLPDPLLASSVAVYIHGEAGDRLAREYSEYGVTPSDLPKEMARVIMSLFK